MRARGAVGVTWVWAVFAACAADTTILDETPPPPAAAVQRLVAYGYEGGGDAVIVTAVRDRTLDLHCGLQPDDEGAWRCFPDTLYNVDGLFADAECRTPAVSVRTDAPRPPYAASFAQECGEVDHTTMYETIGEPIPTAYFVADGMCRSTSNDLLAPARGPFWALRRVPNDRFAAVERDVEILDDDLAHVKFRETDGEWFTAHFEDRKNGQTCRPQIIDGYATCAPIYYGFGMYAEATCGGPISSVAFQWRGCVDPTVGFGLPDGGTCGSATLVRLADRLAPDRPQYGIDGRAQCVARRISGAYTSYEARPVDPTIAIPRMDRVLEGTGRIRAAHFTSSTGAPVGRTNGVFFDTFEDTECLAREVTKTLRCLPRDASLAYELFVDPACTQPISVAASFSTRPVPRIAFDAPGLNSRTDPIEALYEVGEELSQDALFSVGGDGCRSIRGGPFESCRHYFAVGDRLDPNRFAVIDEAELD